LKVSFFLDLDLYKEYLEEQYFKASKK